MSTPVTVIGLGAMGRALASTFLDNGHPTTVPAMAQGVDSGDHSAADSNVAMQATGYVSLLDASRDQGVSTLLAEPMRTLLNRGVAEGLGDGDVSALIDLLEEKK